MNELEALAILTSIPYLGSIKIRLLVQHFGSALQALKANCSELEDLPGFGPKILEAWKSWKQSNFWRENLDLVQKHNGYLIPYTSSQYPKRLLEIIDFPVLLYIKGELKPCDQQSIAIVGTRHATIYGLEMAEKIASGLASMGFTVVSGLARGIDAAAHRGALGKGRTIGVIGSGLANIYPQENIPLAQSILNSGCLISEFPMNTPPDRQNFPQRNRIVSGMTLGTLLIEAPEKSGAMITMEKARMQKRPMFSLPGRAEIGNFRGNHLLIKQGTAFLVENAADIASHFNDFFPKQTEKICPKPHFLLEKEEQKLLNLFPERELSIEEIVEIAKHPIGKLNVLIMSLILKKAIKEFPGKIYRKV